MRIGIVSDTHSRYVTVEKVVARLRQEAIDLVLHCGDIEDADTVWQFEGLTVHFVLGNCDDDRVSLRHAIQDINGRLHEPFGQLELASQRIAWLHGHDRRLMIELEGSDRFDYLFYGHTHEAKQHRTGRTLVVNPGALHRARPKTFAILDLATNTLQSIEAD